MKYDFHDLLQRTDDELEQQIIEGFKFGEYDSTEHDMFLISRDAPTPDEKEIVESVPYMQGVYDYSRLDTSGDRYFDNREITYQVMLFGAEYADRKSAEQEIKRQIMPLGVQNLIDTHDQDYHWQGKCKSITVDDDAKQSTLACTLVFDCYPFAIRNHSEKADIWDEVYFPHWLFQNLKFTVATGESKEIKVQNIGSRTLNPNVEVVGTVTVSGSFGQVTFKEGTYNNTQIILVTGENNFTLSGNGSITFVYYLEEMI